MLVGPPASWTMTREGRAAFLSERIAGAQHFDIDEVADQTSPFPHMVPSETDFQEHVQKVSPFMHSSCSGTWA